MTLSRTFLRALTLAFFVAASVTAAAAPTITEFVLPGSYPAPENITTGPDGNLWFTDFYGQIGRITPAGTITMFDIGTEYSPNAIIAGPDGNLWFTLPGARSIGRLTPAGALAIFPTGITGRPYGITAGPDGNLWFTDYDANEIGRITPEGQVTTFSAGSQFAGAPVGITTGPDGNLWFTHGTTIGRITPAGVVTEFSAGLSPGIQLYSITTGPDGNLWFTELDGNRIGRITPSGVITEFSAGITPDCGLQAITAGPDGNLWFTETFAAKVGRITTDGVVTEYSTGITPGSHPNGITQGPDGHLWFAEASAYRIGKVNLPRFVVNDLGDTSDALPGDGIAADAKGRTTLRAAIEEANFQPEFVAITFTPGLTGRITLTLGGLFIGQSLRLTGPGADLLTLDGHLDSRLFSISRGNVAVTIEGLTLTGGGSTTQIAGGAIFDQSSGRLSLLRCHVTGNRGAAGGAIWLNDSGGLTVSGCTFSDNRARGGGAIDNEGSGEVRIVNSTFSGNTATDDDGGAIRNGTYATLSLINSTFTGNHAELTGGAISSLNYGYIVLRNSIIAGNTAVDRGPDLFDQSGSLVLSNGANFIGDPSGATVDPNDLTFASTGTTLAALLGPLAPNGGPTPTHALPPGSRAIDAGGNMHVPIEPVPYPPFPTDQRGLKRIVRGRPSSGVVVDLGAFEVQAPAPPTFAAGVAANGITLSAGDPPLDLAGPAVGATPAGGTFSGQRVNGGFFDPSTSGLGAHSVTYTATPADAYGNIPTATFTIHVTGLPSPLLVKNRNDDGPDSLRWAVRNVVPGGTVFFEPTAWYGKITLTSGEIVIDKDLTIAGPGARTVTVDGNALPNNFTQGSRVFYLAPGKVATISGLTVQNGNGRSPRSTENGGCILNDSATLIVEACLIAGGTAAEGGGLCNAGHGAIATLTLRHSTVRGCYGYGGAVANTTYRGNATATIVNSTLADNQAPAGGAVYNLGFQGIATLTVLDSTLAGNTASYGGNLYSDGTGGNATVTLANTILALAGSGENFVNANASTTAVSLGGNLADDATATFLTMPGDLPNTPAGLTLYPADLSRPFLADNGGPTPTIALLPTSAAIDAGDDALALDPLTNQPLATDQRGAGFARVVDGDISGQPRIDIGAFEFRDETKDDVVFASGSRPFDIDAFANDGFPTGSAVIYTIKTSPQHGTATLVNGKIRYVPRGPLPPGGDTFTYQFDAGQGVVGTATVTILNFAAIAGSYDGLIADPTATPGTEAHQRAGYLRLTVGRTGSLSGVLTFAGQRLNAIVRTHFRGHGFKSQLDGTGESVRILLRLGDEPITLTLQFDAATRTIRGTAESKDRAGVAFTAPLELQAKTPSGTLAGQYTLLVDPDPAPGSPLGTGFAAVKIMSTGVVRVAGHLADGEPFASSTWLHPDLSFPVYAALYPFSDGAHGSLRGVIQFPALPLPAGDAIGTLAWFKPRRPDDAHFSDGFALSPSALLARYEPPARGSRVLAFNPAMENGRIVLDQSGMPTIDRLFTLSAKNEVTVSPPNDSELSLRLDERTGLFSGSFRLPGGEVTPFAGAVFQADVSGSGFFLGTGPEGGSVDIGQSR